MMNDFCKYYKTFMDGFTADRLSGRRCFRTRRVHKMQWRKEINLRRRQAPEVESETIGGEDVRLHRTPMGFVDVQKHPGTQ